MSTHDYILDNAAGAAFRADLNLTLAAIVTKNSSSTEPGTTYAGMWWYDTANNILYARNSANNAWIKMFTFDQSNNSAHAAGGFQSGTSMLFNQATAPTGWTKKANWAKDATVTVGNDYWDASNNPSYPNNPVSWSTNVSVANHSAHTHTTAGHALSVAEMPGHLHNTPGWVCTYGDSALFRNLNQTLRFSAGAAPGLGGSGFNLNTSSQGGGVSHSHGNTGSTTVSAHSVTQNTFKPAFVRVIAATKD